MSAFAAPVYTAHVSGVEDATTDYTFPVSTLSIGKVDAAASFYTVTTPFTTAIIDALMARQNGKIYIQRNGVAWENFNQDGQVRFDIGATNKTLSISGSRQQTHTGPVALAIPASIVTNYSISATGSVNVTLVPGSLDPKPTDTLQGSNYTVTRVTRQATGGGHSLSIVLTLPEGSPA
jgi:hypothetical protein